MKEFGKGGGADVPGTSLGSPMRMAQPIQIHSNFFNFILTDNKFRHILVTGTSPSFKSSATELCAYSQLPGNSAPMTQVVFKWNY